MNTLRNFVLRVAVPVAVTEFVRRVRGNEPEYRETKA